MTERVLIMDDDHTFLSDLGATLCKADFTVVAATHQAAGRRHLARSEFDVVVSDLCMPGLSGQELLNITRTLDRPPRVVLTCQDDPNTNEVCFESADTVLKKPVDGKTLLEAVHRAATKFDSADDPVGHRGRDSSPGDDFEQITGDEQTKVLVVDDEVSIRGFLGALLPAAGFHTVVCDSADSALNVVSKTAFDVVLSDICMPGMDGLKFCEILRKSHPDLPVILMTGNPDAASRTQAEELSTVAYLSKPFKNTELVALLEKAANLGRVARFKQRAVDEITQVEIPQIPLCLCDDSDLAEALDSFWLAYEPIISVQTQPPVVIGLEALFRSDHEVLNCPERLLWAAKQHERLSEIGRLVRDCAALEIANRSDGRLLFVNVHPLELLDDALTDRTRPLSRIANRVVLEITERATFDGIKTLVRDRIARLRDLGFRIAMDKLGTGSSALTNLILLEPDFVKLDRVLTKGVDKIPLKQQQVASMLDVCRDLGIVAIAKGVETVREYRTLRDLGCELLQGFWLSRTVGSPPATRD